MFYENLYIEAVKSTLNINGKILKIDSLEKYECRTFSDLSIDETLKLYNKVKNGMTISQDNIEVLLRLILREVIWCKLLNNDMFVHFGYDYYMYIGCHTMSDTDRNILTEKGLFIEDFNSPYGA